MNTRVKSLHLWFLIGLLMAASLAGPIPPARAASTTRYLAPAPAGNDSGDCANSAAPCATLQYAISQSAAGDELHLAGGTYTTPQTVNGHIQLAYIDKSLGLYGGFDPAFSSRDTSANPTILDTGGQGRAVFMSGAISVTLDGLQMQNGSTQPDPSGVYPGGGVYATGVTLNLNNSLIQNCHALFGDGGGVYLELGTLQMNDTVVKGNSPLTGDMHAHYGGGLYLTQSVVNITNSQVLNNAASASGYLGEGHGGGIYLDRTNAVIQSTTLHGNLAATGARGFGGGMATNQGSLKLLDSTLDGNNAANLDPGYGGGLYLSTANAELRGNAFTNNTTYAANSMGGAALNIATYWGTILSGNRFENNHCIDCGGGAVLAQGFGGMLIENNQFINNHADRDGGGLLLTGPSTSSSLVTLRNNLLQGNLAGGGGGGIYFAGTVDLLYNQFINNQALNGGGIYQNEAGKNQVGKAIFDGNLFTGNSAVQNGGGLYSKNTDSIDLLADYRNMVFLNNHASGSGGAIFMRRYYNPVAPLTHLTFSGNTAGDSSTVYFMGGNPWLINSIIANAQIGVLTSWIVGLDHVLFDGVATPLVHHPNSTITTDIRVSGSAAFAADGYHLTAASAAVDAGIDAGVITDIDGQPRPLGTAPDLGADESPYSHAYTGMQAWLAAGQPTWKMYYSGPGAPPASYFEQSYLIPFANYTSSLEASTYSLNDQFPAALNLTSTTNQPQLNYSTAGNLLTWSSKTALDPGGWGWIELKGRSDTVLGGTVLNTSGQLQYSLSNGSNRTIPYSASVTVPARPIFPPILSTPFDGEMCLDDDHQLTVTGLSSAGSIVRIYENNNMMGSVTTASDGKYSITWVSALSETNPVEIHTLACDAGTTCSTPSRSVHIVYPHGNWCPQRSYWDGDVGGTHYEFHFKNSGGNFSTNDFEVPGVPYFRNTLLHLYSCCQKDVNPFRVVADGVEYKTPIAHSGHWFTFNIAAAHSVDVYSNCIGEGQPGGHTTLSHGTVLIDPDGFVFDQKKGGAYDSTSGIFTPVQPLAGITVTAYYWAEEWGTWISWPAQMYDNQVNPQVTGSNGYFAFFTPPGKYYLQATAANGYQSWRSPEINVVSQVVHMNLPVNTISQEAPIVVVKSSPSGLSLPVVFIPPGGSVEWQAVPDLSSPVDTVEGLLVHPAQRLLSSLDPLVNLLGFDSGLLTPGASYRRLFDQPGSFIYTDGYGHIGTVIVTNDIHKAHLPRVSR